MWSKAGKEDEINPDLLIESRCEIPVVVMMECPKRMCAVRTLAQELAGPPEWFWGEEESPQRLTEEKGFMHLRCRE